MLHASSKNDCTRQSQGHKNDRAAPKSQSRALELRALELSSSRALFLYPGQTTVKVAISDCWLDNSRQRRRLKNCTTGRAAGVAVSSLAEMNSFTKVVNSALGLTQELDSLPVAHISQVALSSSLERPPPRDPYVELQLHAKPCRKRENEQKLSRLRAR